MANTVIMTVADQIRESMKGASKEDKKVKQEWVVKLFDAMVIAGKVHNDANCVRKEQISPCLGSAAKEICSKQTSVTDWLFGDDLAKIVEDVSKLEKLATKLKQKPQHHYRQQDKDHRPRDGQVSHGIYYAR